MAKNTLILFSLLLSFAALPAYADDDVVIADSVDSSGFSNMPGEHIIISDNINTDTAPCGLGNQGPCSQLGPGGINPVSGMPFVEKSAPCGLNGNGPCNKLGPGGINPVNGKPVGQKTTPCGLSGLGPCNKLGPGGVTITGKVIGADR